jgi:hypothetical protein
MQSDPDPGSGSSKEISGQKREGSPNNLCDWLPFFFVSLIDFLETKTNEHILRRRKLKQTNKQSIALLTMI